MTQAGRKCMDNLVTVERTSALAGVYKTGKFGVLGIKDTVGVTLQDMPDLVLHQVAAWADTVEEVGAGAAAASLAGIARYFTEHGSARSAETQHRHCRGRICPGLFSGR